MRYGKILGNKYHGDVQCERHPVAVTSNDKTFSWDKTETQKNKYPNTKKTLQDYSFPLYNILHLQNKNVLEKQT